MGRFVGSFFIFIYKNKKSTNTKKQNFLEHFVLTAKAPFDSTESTGLSLRSSLIILLEYIYIYIYNKI
jgi:hypothetical protein